MRDDSLAGQAIATLTAVCRLLDDDGDLNVTPPSATVTVRLPAGASVTFVLHDGYPYLRGDHTGPTSWGFDVEVAGPDGPVHLRVDVDDPEEGSVVTPIGDTTAEQLAGLDERTVNVIVNTLWMARGRADGHPVVKTFCTAVEQRVALQELCDDLRHGGRWARLVRTVAGGTAGTLAADWDGDLTDLADTVDRLRPQSAGR